MHNLRLPHRCKSSIFWDFTQSKLSCFYRRFGTTFSIIRRQGVQEKCMERLTLEGRTDRLSQNVGNKIPTYVKSQNSKDLVLFYNNINNNNNIFNCKWAVARWQWL